MDSSIFYHRAPTVASVGCALFVFAVLCRIHAGQEWCNLKKKVNSRGINYCGMSPIVLSVFLGYVLLFIVCHTSGWLKLSGLQNAKWEISWQTIIVHGDWRPGERILTSVSAIRYSNYTWIIYLAFRERNLLNLWVDPTWCEEPSIYVNKKKKVSFISALENSVIIQNVIVSLLLSLQIFLM